MFDKMMKRCDVKQMFTHKKNKQDLWKGIFFSIKKMKEFDMVAQRHPLLLISIFTNSSYCSCGKSNHFFIKPELFLRLTDTSKYN